MKRIAGIGGATVVGCILLAAPALDRVEKGAPFEARSPRTTLVGQIGGRLAPLAGALSPALREPSHEDLWVSEETLRDLAKYHGTHALKITETQVFIRRDGKWVPVLAL